MNRPDELMREIYSNYQAPDQASRRCRATVQLLSGGALDRSSFDSVCEQADESPPDTLSEELLDLVLHGLRTALLDHKITQAEEALLRQVTRIFRIEEGTFYTYRRGATSEILQMQVRRTLMDGEIDASEEAHLNELQRILGLGYDQYLELTRDCLTPVVDEWIAGMDKTALVPGRQANDIHKKLNLLGTFYNLTRGQRRALAAG